MAAPVIWFGSWFLFLMAGSRYAFCCAASSVGFLEKKRGPRGPMHTARIWMASAIPGGAPGYDDDKELGNFITHMTAQTSRRLRKHSCQTLKVNARRHEALDLELSGVPDVRREQI